MKRKVYEAFGAFLVCFLGASPISSHPLNYDSLAPGQNRVAIAMGLEPAVLSSVTYLRSIAIRERPLALSFELALPVAHFDVRDYRAEMGAQMSLLRFGGFHLAGEARIISRGTRNDIFDAHGLGADLTVSAGYYGLRRFVALEAGFDKNVATYISHRDWYRDYFYAGAVDGWYESMGGTWHGGIVGGVSLARFEVAARVELQRSEGWNGLLPPYEGILSLAYLF